METTNVKAIEAKVIRSKNWVKYLAICTIVLGILVSTGIGVYNVVTYITNMQDTLWRLSVQNNTLTKYKGMYEDIKVENLQLKSDIATLKGTIEMQNQTITTTDTELKQLIADNTKLQKDNVKLDKKNAKLADRLKTYETYKYACFYDGKRTDLTYDQIKLGETLMKEKGYNPHILFSIGMVESGYDTMCTNKSSTAKGYHQFLNGTAKFTYETLLGHGKGSWYASIAYNPEVNIRMCAAYFDHLMKKHGSFDGAMGHYCGSRYFFNRVYKGRMDDYLSQAGLSIYSIPIKI